MHDMTHYMSVQIPNRYIIQMKRKSSSTAAGKTQEKDDTHLFFIAIGYVYNTGFNS